METARFSIKATPIGGRVEVNGEDVTDRVGVVELRVANGQPTLLTLHQAGEGSIEGEGIVHFVTGDDRTDADIICDFLAGIDPELLDHEVLNSADVSQNLTAALLTQLQRYARGDHGTD